MTVRLIPVEGLPEIVEGADLAALLLAALAAGGERLAAGDVLAVSSKVVSKALGLRRPSERRAVIESQTVRVVAERAVADGCTRIVESVAGPVMAAAGVDASNVGPEGGVLVLPPDPDAAAAALLGSVRTASGVGVGAPLAVVLTDTAGRPWRAGQTDFALGAAGLRVLLDHRGGVDADGRPLSVTAMAVADEIAAAADLVKGKSAGVAAAVVRGLPPDWFADDEPGAARLVRRGPRDWFALGQVEAVRESLGVAPGSPEAAAIGVRGVGEEPLSVRVQRAVAVALVGVPGVRVLAQHTDDAAFEVVLGGEDDLALGVAVGRLGAAASAEDLALPPSRWVHEPLLRQVRVRGHGKYHLPPHSNLS